MSIDLLSKSINNYLEIIKTGPLLNELNESQIAIVCHCSKKHQTDDPSKLHNKLYYINKNKNSSIPFNNIIKELEDGIKYIDPSCPDDNWGNIEDKTLMYIWGINCSIYGSYVLTNSSSKIINDILKNSYKKLDIGGKVLFPLKKRILPVGFTDPNDRLHEYFKTKIRSDEDFAGFAFEIVSINKFPYIISVENDFDIEEYYVFTKI